MKIKVILLGVMGLLLSNIVLANHEIGISDSKITIHDDELNIVLFEALAKGKYSGDFNKEIIIEKPVKKITFGSDNKVIWQN